MSKYYFYNWEYISVHEQVFSSMLVLASLLGTDSDPIIPSTKSPGTESDALSKSQVAKTRPVIQFFGLLAVRLDWALSLFILEVGCPGSSHSSNYLCALRHIAGLL